MQLIGNVAHIRQLHLQNVKWRTRIRRIYMRGIKVNVGLT
nr:MAG TPA: hypothetical protein [Caudoviricetes sp.]